MPPLPIGQATFNIPEAIVRQWLALPSGRPLTLTITRTDVDALFHAIDESIGATSQLQKSLIDYTHGRVDEANEASALVTQKLIAASNQLRAFMNAVMAGAVVAE